MASEATKDEVVVEVNSPCKELTETVEDVRKLVAEEGLSARNLLIWNVPLEESEMQDGSCAKVRRPPVSPRTLSSKVSIFESVRRGSKRSPVYPGKTRIRSASAGRDPKLDFKARYWTFLFENLRRAVDEIYETCETDNSIAECKEAIMVLENYTKDFHSLIDYINIKRDYDSTPVLNRPTSLAWEIRRPSSRTNIFAATLEQLNKAGMQRALKFDSSSSETISSLPRCTSCGVQTEPEIFDKGIDQTKTTDAKDVTVIINKCLDVVSSVTQDNPKTPPKIVPATHVASNSVPQVSIGSRAREVGTSRIRALSAPKQRVESSFGVAKRSINTSPPTCIKKSNDNVTDVTKSADCSKKIDIGLSNEMKADSISSLSSTSFGSHSWADRVRGGHQEANGIMTPTTEEDEESFLLQDDDTEGWETVQRVRSKLRTSPPHKFSASSPGNVRSNSISGFEMYSEKSSRVNNSNTTRRSPQIETVSNGKPLRNSQMQATTSPNTKLPSRPKSSKSLPSLHVKTPERSPNQIVDKSKKTVSSVTKLKTGLNSPGTLDILKSGLKSGDSKKQPFTNNIKVKDGFKYTASGNVMRPSDLKKQSSDAKLVTGRSSTIAKTIHRTSVSVRQSRELNTGKNITSKRSHPPENDKDVPGVVETNPVDAIRRAAIPEDQTESPCEKSVPVSLLKVGDDCGDKKDIPLVESSIDKSLTNEDDDSVVNVRLSGEDSHHIENMLEGRLTPVWSDCMEHLDSDVRPPGRVLQIHEKLSSPSRKRPLSESKRRHEEKQAKAQEQREKLLEERAQQWKDTVKKLEETRQRQEEAMQQKRLTIEAKLQRAEENRREKLQLIVRKAHDEEEKVNEIAFINSLEAQNKRHDVMSRIQGHEARLQDIQEERQRRQGEKAAKEAAVEERRKALEAERQAKLKIMEERRRQKQYKIEQHQQEKEKERQELAREKARDREERLSARQAAQQANMEELQKKIQQKQEDSARRHEENIEHIRQKAFELSITKVSSTSDDAPRLVPYEFKKLCTLCNVLIGSDVYLLSHLRGKKHKEAIQQQYNESDPSREKLESYNLKHIIDAPADKIDPQIALDKERQKALKKRCKKLRHRMTTRGVEYLKSSSSEIGSIESEQKIKMQKCIREIGRCFQQDISGPWPINRVTSLDRMMGEISRIIERKCPLTVKRNDQIAFRSYGGFAALNQVLNVITGGTAELNTVIPSRTLINACHLYELLCKSNHENCQYLLASNQITVLLDLLIHRLCLLIPDDPQTHCLGSGVHVVTSLPVDAVASALLQLLATVLNCLTKGSSGCVITGSLPGASVTSSSQIELLADSISSWINDILSYAVSVGIVDKLSQYFNNVRGPIDDEPMVAEFLQQGMAFLLALTQLLAQRHPNIFEKTRLVEDNTQLVATFQITELVGAVSLLYGMLLHSGAPSRGQTPPPQLSHATLTVIASSLHMLNHFAVLDLNSFQIVLGAEGTSLEFRHIVSYLLWYCSHWPNEVLLHELILSVDYFVVLNSDNQAVIQAGHMPTVLQQLCLLPFPYFSDPALVNVLFPTLISCCFQNDSNAAILEQEVSCELLAHFIEEDIQFIRRRLNRIDIYNWTLLSPLTSAEEEEDT